MKTMKDWPESERPRERLLREGVAALSEADLLAIFLRSGTQGQHVKDLALSLLKKFGGLEGLFQQTPFELQKISGLGPAKTASLIAAFELGKRVLGRNLEKKVTITSAQDLFDFLRYSLQHEKEEVLLGVLLSAKNELLKILPLNRGDFTGVHLSVAQTLRRVLLEGAPGFILVHNHPSGDPEPSQEDIRLTQRMKQACQSVDLLLHDHLIIATHSFYSFAEEGFI
ncbi:MAG: DNA repair protein RadC [Deltaproteobacteria bacterium]|nr:DNA repair protein RadC [Deltaproteobacteria bacterium]